MRVLVPFALVWIWIFSLPLICAHSTTTQDVNLRHKPQAAASKNLKPLPRRTIPSPVTPATHLDSHRVVATAKVKDVSLFPIAKHELKKFLMMSGMMFFIIYVYTVVRDTKDTLIVSHCGAEAITFLKVYGVLPAAAMFMVAYAKMSNALSKRKLFYVTAIPFFAFYALFCLVLYPFRNVIQPSGDLGATEGIGFFFKIIQYWTISLYYVVSELFGSVGVSVLFWQLANDIVPVDQAKRFYPLFGQLANLAPIAAGQTVVLSAKMTNPNSPDSFRGTINLTTTFIMISGCAILALYHNIMNLRDKELAEGASASPKSSAKAPKPKLTMVQSFKFLLSSPYLGFLAILVISYGLSINFTEVMWKSQVKKLLPDKTDYQKFMGNYSTALGATTFFIIFFGSNVVKILGWKVGALTTPVLMAALAAPFFGFIIFGLKAGDPKMALRTAVYVGLLQNIFSKSVKYALFDPTKEMAYIPLDQESKVKGKAAIDVLAARIGKSGGALLQQAIVLYYGNVISGAPVIAAMFYLVIGAWIFAACRLGDLFAAKLKEKDASTKQQ